MVPDHSFACPHCGDWLPTQWSYETFRGSMNTAHTCLCGQTHTYDLGPKYVRNADIDRRLRPWPNCPPWPTRRGALLHFGVLLLTIAAWLAPAILIAWGFALK